MEGTTKTNEEELLKAITSLQDGQNPMTGRGLWVRRLRLSEHLEFFRIASALKFSTLRYLPMFSPDFFLKTGSSRQSF
ncbi:MAG: hypothetical protein Q4E55_06500 [Bacteroidales bacterium]|nr:hypothetical protein [Bacteroidales bacterium]